MRQDVEDGGFGEVVLRYLDHYEVACLSSRNQCVDRTRVLGRNTLEQRAPVGRLDYGPPAVEQQRQSGRRCGPRISVGVRIGTGG